MGRGLWLAVLLSILTSVVTAQGVTWDFEKNASQWQARTPTVIVRRVSSVGATGVSTACLQVAGVAGDGWNYACAGRIPVEANSRYLFRAWARVDRVGAETPMPYLKCEFVSQDGTSLGRALTSKYLDARMGQWQLLSCEFETPVGTVEGAVALEKGTSDATDIDAYLDDVTVEPFEENPVFAQYDDPGQALRLQRVRGVHPRLFLTDERIAELRRVIQTTHAPLWNQVRTCADSLAQASPPPYQPATSGADAQLWQRPVGNAMPYLALAYRLSGERRYLEAAQQWALASCNYPTWGVGAQDGVHLATGHQLFGLALVYDWCYYDLDRPTRDRIRETLHARASAMFRAVATGTAWWHKSILQNQLWVNTCGVGTAGLALFDEVAEARLWVGLAVDKFQATMDALGPDGASYEGIGYWEYGAEYMVKFMCLARDLLDIDFYDCSWWKNTARYCLYLSLPHGQWTRDNCVVDLADSPRGHWYGPDHILRNLAATYRDGHAQWLADQIDTKDVESTMAQWLSLLSYTPSVKPTPPTSLPTLREFEDMGIVSARTGWSGYDNLVVFKCGPFLGHKAVTKLSYAPGGGHSHPDAGHFVIFGNGEWLIQDDGYRAKWTHQHNTLLIDGEGQLGEGSTAFRGTEPFNLRLRPRVLKAVSTPRYDHIAGDATQAYPSSLGLTRFVRHLLFVKPDVVLVLDDVLCSVTRQLELRFHPGADVCERAGSSCAAVGWRTTLLVDLLTPQGVTVESKWMSAQTSTAQPDHLLTIRYTHRDRSWRNATALSWSPNERDPKTVALYQMGNIWMFLADGRKILFDWSKGEVVGQP